MGSPQIEQIETTTEVDDAYLVPWVDWMDSVDFDSLWE